MEIEEVKINYLEYTDWYCVGEEWNVLRGNIISISVEIKDSFLFEKEVIIKLHTSDNIINCIYKAEDVKKIVTIYKKEEKQDGELSAL